VRTQRRRISIVAASLLCAAACASPAGDARAHRRFVVLGTAVVRDTGTELEWTRRDVGAGLDWNSVSSESCQLAY
jgi:hypothetical protein